MLVDLALALLAVAPPAWGAAMPAVTEPALLHLRAPSDATDDTETSFSCVREWCQDDTSMCLYWGGITGWDASHGPVPGMVHTTLGSCGVEQDEAEEASDQNEPATAAVDDNDDDDDDDELRTATRRKCHDGDGDGNGDGEGDYQRLSAGVAQASATTTAPPADSDSAAATSIECKKEYCNEHGSRMCHYWGGVTGWDVSLGPVPGMTVTNLGPCPTDD